MKFTHFFRLTAALGALTLLGGCATRGPSFDYTAFREARPASILVLPPLNHSPEVGASNSLLSFATLPLAESGYYVLPVTLVNETFKENGLQNPPEIHEVSVQKLREIFGADAALYIDIKQYGTVYAVVMSETRVTAEGKLVDLRNGRVLWTGRATASSNEGNNNSGGGIAGLLIKALVSQIADSMTNRGHQIAGITSQRLLSAGQPNGILYGPRSPKYQKDGSPSP